VHVPLWVTADPAKMPHIGFSQAWTAGRDQAIAEGSFFGNIMDASPPAALYAKANGFKASIAGRLGASDATPYAPFEGYVVGATNQFVSGVVEGLCSQKDIGDGEHFDTYKCQRGDANGALVQQWTNVVNTFVNANYNSTVTQNMSGLSLNFDGEAAGVRTASKREIWTTTKNFEFQNTVNAYGSGKLVIGPKGDGSGRALCQPNAGEHIVITKNTGEPFSLVNVKIANATAKTAQTITITGYARGSSTLKRATLTPSDSGTSLNFSGWDGLIKVELRGPQGQCLDSVGFKT
jgi:hypothetical protein